MNQLCVCVFCQTQFSKEVSLEVLIDYIVFKIEDEDQFVTLIQRIETEFYRNEIDYYHIHDRK